MILFGAGTATRAGKASITPEALARVIEENGTLPVPTVLRCRLRHFSDGAVLGTKAFVATQLAAYRRRTGLRKRTRPRPLPNVADWGDMTTLRGLRKNIFGTLKKPIAQYQALARQIPPKIVGFDRE